VAELNVFLPDIIYIKYVTQAVLPFTQDIVGNLQADHHSQPLISYF
jgi:hypothetical protein